LAIPSAVRCSLTGLRWSPFSVQSSTLFEFRLPPEYYPADPSQPAAARRLLSWASVPYSTSGIEDPPCRELCPLATFRLQGLVTLLTVSALRFRAGFISHRQRSWDSPFGACSLGGYPCVSTRMSPRTVPPAGIPSTRRCRAGPAGPGSWALAQPRVSVGERGFRTRTAGSSHGFRPSRVRSQRPWPGFRPASSLALRTPGSHPPDPPAPQSVTQSLAGPTRLRGKPRSEDEATLIGSLHPSAPTHSGVRPSGAMRSPGAAPHVAADRPTR
jgi:hypothetical protein